VIEVPHRRGLLPLILSSHEDKKALIATSLKRVVQKDNNFPIKPVGKIHLEMEIYTDISCIHL
jgi:hypothetical protein